MTNKYLNRIEEGFGLDKEASVKALASRAARRVSVAAKEIKNQGDNFVRGYRGKPLDMSQSHNLRGTRKVKNLDAYLSGSDTKDKVNSTILSSKRAIRNASRNPYAMGAITAGYTLGVGSGIGAGMYYGNKAVKSLREKMANDHLWTGIISKPAQARAIAKQYGKTGPVTKKDIGKVKRHNLEEEARSASNHVTLGALGGLAAGIGLRKRLSPLAFITAPSVGAVAGGTYGGLKTSERNARMYHNRYGQESMIKKAAIGSLLTRGFRVAKVGVGRQLKTMSSFNRGLTGKNLPVNTIRGTQSIKNMNAFGAGAATRANIGNAYSRFRNSPVARSAAWTGVGAGAGYMAANKKD